MKAIQVATGAMRILCLIATACSVEAPRAWAQGTFEPIKESDVVALDLMHYYTPKQEYRTRDFAWVFTKKTFVIIPEKGDVPKALVEEIAGPGVRATTIKGKWKLLAENGMELVLTDILVDGKPPVEALPGGKRTAKKREVRMPFYRTAPTVVRLAATQYVFVVKEAAGDKASKTVER